MAMGSRVLHLQNELMKLGFYDTLRALKWMMDVMNAENGFARHDGSDYYLHLVDGCQDLINHGITEQEILTAFILHDAVEDVEWITENTIVEGYGSEVAFLVMGVTKKDGVDYKIKKNQEEYLEYILQFLKMCLIKTADRKHNFSTLEHASPEKELRQAKETEELFMPFFKQARQLYPEYSSYFHSAKTTIMPHLKKILKYHADIEAKDNRIKELEFKLELLSNNK